MRADTFNNDSRVDWPLFRSVASARKAFSDHAKILVAIGGWGDMGFDVAGRTEKTRHTFARNVARMVEATGADGVDIDWEYPGGNGDDYKHVPNSEKAWEIGAYPLLISEIRSALGPKRLMTAAVPGLERDMMAFTNDTVPAIMKNLDFLNVMTYDLMNRRDTVTKHHSSIEASRATLNAYISRGAPANKLILGLGFYTKYFRTERDDCANAKSPIGCKTLLLEDPKTGSDLGRTGGFSWHDPIPEDVASSFARALKLGRYDQEEGAYYYWDKQEALWWTFDDPNIVMRKVSLLAEMKLAGVFAWGLGEDAPDFTHLRALFSALWPQVESHGHIRDEL